jgi:hypothetical protein
MEDFEPYGVTEIIRRLPKYFTISVASRRNSGKSVLISELVRELIKQKKVDMTVVMSGSAGLNDDWNFLPKKLVMPFSDATLESIWATQQKQPKDSRKHTLIVLDDALATPEALRNNTIMRYYSLGRHISASFICISQHTASLLSPAIKANSDIILWSKLNQQQLEQLWAATVNITKKDFIALSEKFGGHNYNFMLMDNYEQTHSSPTGFLSIVRAQPPAK